MCSDILKSLKKAARIITKTIDKENILIFLLKSFKKSGQLSLFNEELSIALGCL
jgi:hypothetical protein